MIKKPKISLNSVIFFTFLIGVFCLPLNSDPPYIMKLFGEYRNESIALFFMISCSFLIGRDFIKGKVKFPYKDKRYQIFLFFIVYLAIGFFLHFEDIKHYLFKETGGIIRFIKQIVSVLIISVGFLYLFYNVILIKGVIATFYAIRKVMLYSLILVCVYGTIEAMIIYLHMNFLIPITKLFDYLPFVETSLDFFGRRLLGLTYEPPALGTFLVTIAGFMYSYILTGKKIFKFIPYLLVLIFAILSKSRAAFVIILVQTILGITYSYIIFPKFRYWFNRGVVVFSVIMSFVIFYKHQEVYHMLENRIADLNFLDKSMNNELSISNKSRLGIQYANLQVFKDNPIFGVGWGQQTYEAIKYIPSWSKYKNWEYTYKYLNPNHPPFPPGYNLYTRLLAETGIIGFLIFISFLISILYKMIVEMYNNTKNKFILLVLLMTTVGAYVNWFQTDTLRLYGFWFSLAILLVLIKEKKYVGESFK